MPYRLVFAIALMTATAAPAALSCRDSKGAFTPCTPRQLRDTAGKARVHERDGRPAVASGEMTRPARPAKPLIARSRLCRDSKGLFTPCPR